MNSKDAAQMDFHAESPELLNPCGAMALAADSILYRLDAASNYRPYFYIKGRDGVPAYLQHGQWDLGDMTGRYLESMVMTRRMVGARPAWSQAESRLANFLLSLYGDGGLIMDIDRGVPDHMFAQGSALYGLVAAYTDSGDKELERAIERHISGLLAHGQHVEDYLVYPEVATSAPCSHMAAYQVFPAMDFYESTGYGPALELAEKLSRWAFLHDDTIGQDGVVKRAGWEGHLHAWMDALCGVMRFAKVSSAIPREDVVLRCKKTYDWVRQTQATEFGWVPDFPGSPTSETCAISSMMRMALQLISSGFSEYWDDLERFTRNQLVENQFRNVDSLGIADPQVAGALSGAFDCWANPNSLLASVRQWGKEDDGDVEGCCVNGGQRGLYMAWQNATTSEPDRVSVNLLFSHETKDAVVCSMLPREGRLQVRLRGRERPCELMIRVPSWASEVVVTRDGVPVPTEQRDRRIRLGDVQPETTVAVVFAVPERQTRSVAGPCEYTLDWRADTVMGISPAGTKYPIYVNRRAAPVSSENS